MRVFSKVECQFKPGLLLPWSSPPLSLAVPLEDLKDPSSRPISLPLGGRPAQILRCQFAFADRWMLISEISFYSGTFRVLLSFTAFHSHSSSLLFSLILSLSLPFYSVGFMVISDCLRKLIILFLFIPISLSEPYGEGVDPVDTGSALPAPPVSSATPPPPVFPSSVSPALNHNFTSVPSGESPLLHHLYLSLIPLFVSSPSLPFIPLLSHAPLIPHPFPIYTPLPFLFLSPFPSHLLSSLLLPLAP